MHKSRLACLVIDCNGDNLAAGAGFWAEALGLGRADGQPDPKYVKLVSPPDQPDVLVQKVDHQSRVHLDIETDDIDAEVTRLERLGARRVEALKGWVVMEAPTGHRFCVVKPQRPDFAESARVWDR